MSPGRLFPGTDPPRGAFTGGGPVIGHQRSCMPDGGLSSFIFIHHNTLKKLQTIYLILYNRQIKKLSTCQCALCTVHAYLYIIFRLFKLGPIFAFSPAIFAFLKAYLQDSFESYRRSGKYNIGRVITAVSNVYYTIALVYTNRSHHVLIAATHVLLGLHEVTPLYAN